MGILGETKLRIKIYKAWWVGQVARSETEMIHACDEEHKYPSV